MKPSRLKLGFLRALDGLLDTASHPSTREPHAVDRLAPFLQVLRRLRRLGKQAESVSAIRQRFHSDMADFQVGFPIGSVQDMAIPTDQGLLAARLYRPSSAVEGAPLTVYFHGGGFVMGTLDTHDDACRLLCESSGMPLLAVAYRLAPESPFPAAVDDALASAQWALKMVDVVGAAGLALGGDSAGANLAAVTAQRMAQDGQHVAAQLLIYPGTDLSRYWPSHDAFGDGYFLDRSERDIFYSAYLNDVSLHATDVRVSPMLNRVPNGTAPALIVTAGYDMLKDEGQAYAQRLQEAGVPVQQMLFPCMGHAFINLASIHRASRAAVQEMGLAWRELALKSHRS